MVMNHGAWTNCARSRRNTIHRTVSAILSLLYLDRHRFKSRRTAHSFEAWYIMEVIISWFCIINLSFFFLKGYFSTHNHNYVFLFGRLIGLAIDRYETPSQVWSSLIRSVYATISSTQHQSRTIECPFSAGPFSIMDPSDCQCEGQWRGSGEAQRVNVYPDYQTLVYPVTSMDIWN